MGSKSLRFGWFAVIFLLATFVAASSALATGDTPQSTGSVQLIDGSGFEWFLDTNITFVTSSSASGACSEASFTAAVTATTSAGGTIMSTLNDAFDGYNTLCISQTNATGPCITGSADYDIYSNNGVGAFDATSSNRQFVFNAQAIGDLSVVRKFYVPDDDSFARWLNIITNNGAAPVTFTVVTGNNLGSDSNTIIFDSSNGDTTADLTDTWVGTMQNYSGNTSSDARLGHILQGEGAEVPLNNINFVNGDDNPYWSYQLTLQPGETQIIANFATGQPCKDSVRAKAEDLVSGALAEVATRYMTADEISQVVNFAINLPPTDDEHGTGHGGGHCFIDSAF